MTSSGGVDPRWWRAADHRAVRRGSYRVDVDGQRIWGNSLRVKSLQSDLRAFGAGLVVLAACGGLGAATAASSGCASSEADTGGSGTDDGGASVNGDGSGGGGGADPDSGSTGGGGDANADGAKPAGDAGALPDGATWKTSLRVCWNDPNCTRALAIGHGGDWAPSGPAYDSNAALAAAVASGADGVKIDVRYTKDNVGVISHSSPIQLYESVDCNGKKIEEMTVAQVTSCHRVPGNETFQKLDDVLDTLRGKLAIQICVKVNTEFGKTIQNVLAKSAQDFAFIEVNSPGDFAQIPALPGAGQIYYVVNVGSSVADIDTVIGFKNPRIIMLEIDPSVALNGMAATKIHPAGMHTFAYQNSDTATQSDLKALFDQGYDIVSSNVTKPDVAARIQTNQGRSVSPP